MSPLHRIVWAWEFKRGMTLHMEVTLLATSYGTGTVALVCALSPAKNELKISFLRGGLVGILVSYLCSGNCTSD